MPEFRIGLNFDSKAYLSRPHNTKTSACKFLVFLGAVGTALSFAAYCQSAPSSLDIPLPTASGVLGRADAGASAELIAHLKAVGLSPWTGMQGTGQIAYGNDPATYSATLTIIGSTEFRLDAGTERGQFSMRIDGSRGEIQEADGRRTLILPNTAASGLVQFQLLRQADFPNPKTSLLDRGIVTVKNQALHRLTYEFPAVVAALPMQKQQTIAADLYFDPMTHLLVKSANTIRINGAGNHDFLREITYEDYRQVGSSMIPFRYTETLNGQKLWTLQFSDVQLSPNLQTTYFEF